MDTSWLLSQSLWKWNSASLHREGQDEITSLLMFCINSYLHHCLKAFVPFEEDIIQGIREMDAGVIRPSLLYAWYSDKCLLPHFWANAELQKSLQLFINHWKSELSQGRVYQNSELTWSDWNPDVCFQSSSKHLFQLGVVHTHNTS